MTSPKEAYNLKIVSEPFVHDDRVYFILNWIENDEYKSSVYVYDGEKATRLTFGGHEKSPQLNGDKLYYISYSDKGDSLVVKEGLRESRKLFSSKSVSRYIFHGDAILAIAMEDAEDGTPFVTERLRYRANVPFSSSSFLRARKKLILIEDDSAKTLVKGDFEILDVASNGRRVVFTATIEDDDRGLEDIFELNLADGTYKKVTAGHGKAGTPCISRDDRIAYTGHRKGLTPWAASRLLFPEEGKGVEIGNTASNSVVTDLFVPSRQSLIHDNGLFYLEGQEGGSVYLYSYDGEKAEKLTAPRRVVTSFHVADGKVAYVYTTPEKPSILVFNGEYDPNPDVKGRKLDSLETGNGDAWLMTSSKESPTVLSVHGGPHFAYGEAYSIEFNFLADNGFNVLFGNPRGSEGYGEEFTSQSVGDWDNKPFKDLIGFVDRAKSMHGLREEFAITGGSYGGYMTNAAIVQTNRFKCAIAERCVSNLMSMCGTSDIGSWYFAMDSGVEDQWSPEGMRKLLEMSPITRAKNVRTPTLFMHGEVDYRTPIEQSEQMYTAIKLNGVESAFVRYPGDSHEHARHGNPKNMKDRLDRKLDWFRKYMD